MNRRGVVVSAVAILVAAVLLVAIGRHERRSDLQARNREIAQIAKLVDANLASKLTAYRQAPWFGCLLFGLTPSKPFGVELCFDQEGRLIEAIDRRGSTTHIGTLRLDPSAATTRIAPSRLLALLRKRAPRRFPATLTALPQGSDLGPVLLTQRKPRRGA